jgi:hypothetical protein
MDKEIIQKALTDTLAGIAKNVMTKSTQTTEPAKTEPVVTDTKSQTTETPAGDELGKKVETLTTQVGELTKSIELIVKGMTKPAGTETPAGEDLEKKKQAATVAVNDIVKAMGIDTDNVEVDFVIKEKKKGTVETDPKAFGKKVSENGEGEEEETDGDQFTKTFNSLDESGKKELSDAAWKKMLGM